MPRRPCLAQIRASSFPELLLEDLKTANSRRTIPLSPRTLDVLAARRERQENDHSEVDPSRPEYEDPIFHSPGGRPYDPATVWANFQQLLEDCGLPRMTLHALRDTAATSVLVGGIDAKTIAERLGRSDVGLTLRVYSHITPSMHRDAAERLEELYELSDSDANSSKSYPA
jgi:integrase